MSDSIVVIPSMKELLISTTDGSLYNYNFDDFSLVPIQKLVSKNIYMKIDKELTKNFSNQKIIKNIMSKDKFEYVAKLTDSYKKKLRDGDISFIIEKSTGETKGVLRESISGKTVKIINLDKKNLKDLGNLPQLAAMQKQLSDISEQIEDLNFNIKRVEQGQYNDRYSGFYSTRQLLMESIAIENVDLQRQVLSNAIQSSNETIGKLMITLKDDVKNFLDYSIKQKEADVLENRISESLSYLNSTVQLIYIAYTILEETKALLSSMTNYKAFLDQIFLTPIGTNTKSAAWRIDNTKKDDAVKFYDLTRGISENIENLINNKFWVESEELQYEDF